MSEITLGEVLERELEQIRVSRKPRFTPNAPHKSPEESLIGLAFSGGGIRSATFNLGILQALAQNHLLRCFDYISTVSGGGYIGSWLMAWMHHQKIGIREVEDRLAPHAYAAAQTAEPPEVRFLRNYSNYLTPQKGILSADFWAFAASYLRNTLLNQAILLLFLLSLLLVPRVIVWFPQLFEAAENAGVRPLWLQYSQEMALVLGLALGLIAVIAIGLNLCWVNPPKEGKPCWIAQPWAIHLLVLIPLFLTAALFSYALSEIFQWDVLQTHLLIWAPCLGVAVYGGLWLPACIIRKFAQWTLWRRCVGGPSGWIIAVTSFLTGGLSGFLFVPYASVLAGARTPDLHLPWGLWPVLTFGPPAFVGIMLVAGALHIGLMGRRFGDAYREWWARLGGWLLIYAACWLLLFLMVIYVPVGLGLALEHYKVRSFGTVLVWIASTAYGVFFGKSPLTGALSPDSSLKKQFAGWAARLTPYIFIAGLLAGLSVLASNLAAFLTGQDFLWDQPNDFVGWQITAACLLLAIAGVALSWRVDINAFSTHMLYRNRLVTCYLGASVPKRHAQPFTGFSAEDNVPLANLQIPVNEPVVAAHGRPIPLLNASLNVARGKELALQTRKARSFVLSPACSGYARPIQTSSEWQSAFAETAQAGSKKQGTENGITLGTAVAISGAAASPNMGFHSSRALAFLMTLFDVRLGWWLGNPRKDQKWKKGSPDLGFSCLLQELFGAASDDSGYVYLSDGGHFENLAIYELVRRRCKLIVAGDASCDPGYGFGDLHNAMERCRMDFGVEIELDASALKSRDNQPGEHFVVGKIHYTPGDKRDDGTLIYLKPVLRDGAPNPDPADLLGYRTTNKCFPHDTTANQWFDENHFENYRNLGYVTGLAAAKDIREEVDRVLG